MNNIEITNELIYIGAELDKSKAILGALGYSAMYGRTKLLDDEQKMLIIAHEDNSNLYHATMDYVFSIEDKLNTLIKALSEGRTGENENSNHS